MQLDYYSLFFTLALTNVILALTFISYIIIVQEKQWVLYAYTGHKVLEAATLILMALRNQIPDFLSIDVANVVFYASIVSQHVSIVSYKGQFQKTFFEIIGGLSLLSVAVFFGFHYSEKARIVASSFTIIGLYAFTALYLLRLKDSSRMRFFISFSYLVLSISHVVRIYGVLHAGDNYAFTNFMLHDKIILLSGIFTILVSTFGFLLMLRDHNEYIIKCKNRKLDKINKSKDELFSIVAHDLRSPLSSFPFIMQKTKQALTNNNRHELTNWINMAEQLSNNAFYLVDNLLNWAVSQNDNISYKPSIVVLNDLIKTVVDYQLTLAQKKHIQLQTHFGCNEKVYVDENMLEISFRNLLSNAIKFTPEHGQISVAVKPLSDKVLVEFSDTGTGIAHQKLKKIFEFSETKSTFGTANEKGTGLGLILVYKFIKQNKGSISVNSRLGVGTTFTVELPLAEKTKTDM